MCAECVKECTIEGLDASLRSSGTRKELDWFAIHHYHPFPSQHKRRGGSQRANMSVVGMAMFPYLPMRINAYQPHQIVINQSNLLTKYCYSGLLFLALQDAVKVMYVSDWLSGRSPTWLMWPWWVRIRDARPAPPRPAEKRAAPPRLAEIDKTRGAQRGKADCRLHRLCPHIWAKNGEENEMKEKLFIWSFVQLVIIWFAERPFKSQRM